MGFIVVSSRKRRAEDQKGEIRMALLCGMVGIGAFLREWCKV
jgi:hypothetical protein